MTEAVLPVTGCPSCGARAEPEEEDGLRKYVCTDQDSCGYEFGFVLAAQPDADCQLGIPEEVRRGASLVPPSRATFLGDIGRRPE